MSEAVSIMKERYPGHHVRVTFSIEPEEFFLGGPDSAEQKRNHSEEAFYSTASDSQGGA